jgi:hypothetical protein
MQARGLQTEVRSAEGRVPSGGGELCRRVQKPQQLEGRSSLPQLLWPQIAPSRIPANSSGVSTIGLAFMLLALTAISTREEVCADVTP